MILHYLSKRDFVILLGNIIDHFDTSIYVFLAPLIAPLFFPHRDPTISLIYSYSVLATSIVSRPIGSYLFASLAGYCNAARILSYSLIGVGMATLCIGMLPTYQAIGALAPFLLVTCRILKGLCAAGESTIASLYILGNEKQHAVRKSSLYQSSTIIGIILASSFATLVHYAEFEHAWRIPFWLGGSLSFVGYKLRQMTLDKQEMRLTKPTSKSWKNLYEIWRHKTTILRIAIINGLSQLTYSIPFVVMNSIIPLISDIELATMMVLNSSLLLFDLFAIPTIGSLVARFPAQVTMKYASLVLFLSIIPLWILLENASLLYVTFVRIWIVIFGIIYLCPLGVWSKDQVEDSQNRYLIVGAGATLSSILIGKLTPTICLIIYQSTGMFELVVVYISAIFGLAWLILRNC